MSRPQLSAEQRTQIYVNYIHAAWDIIKADGMAGLTLRKVSAKAGYNSATLYHYFHDLDELATYAALRFLRDWERELTRCVQESGDPAALIYSIWENLCQMAFQRPRILHTLFFGKYSDKLAEIMARYVTLLPEEDGSLAETAVMSRVFAQGSLLRRNMTLLLPLADGGALAPGKLDLCNEIIVFCFKNLLEEKIRQGDALDSGGLTERQLGYIRVALGG